jgi:cholesterol transport system auxiliary component
MAYKPAPYKIAVYNGSRWRVNPGDMVTDFLLRDLRNSGIFKGAFSYRDDESVRFVLEGGVDEFLEVDEQNTGKAVISLTIALIDTNEKEITKRLVFQKKYRAEEPLTEQSPAALAQGMSTSMKRVSEQLLKDIYSSLQKSGK